MDRLLLLLLVEIDVSEMTEPQQYLQTNAYVLLTVILIKALILVNLTLLCSDFHIFKWQEYIIFHLHSNHMDSMRAGFFSAYPAGFFSLLVYIK